MKYIILFLLTYHFQVWSYTPSLESLLRNGSNANIDNNTVIANLSISEIDPENNRMIIKEEIPQLEAVKLLILNEKENSPRLCQVNYLGGAIKANTLYNFIEIEFKNLSNKFSSVENISGEVFYSVLSVLLNNNGDMLLNLIKKMNGDVKTNRELVNKEKLALLGKYKNYLENSKEEEELENPLKPESEEAMKKVQELKLSQFLIKDSTVKRIKENQKFFWVVETSKIFMKFDENHKLKEFKMSTEYGDFQFLLGRYVIFGSKLEFPEFVWFTDLTGKKYEIKATKLTMFQDSADQHRNRIKRYSKSMEENNLTPPELRFNFLL